MILIDPRDGNKKKTDSATSQLLLRYFRSFGLTADTCLLDSADIMFEGNGPKGRCGIGIERKSLHDMLNCIDTGRYAEQARRMRLQYGVSILIVEGCWKSHEDGWLMEGWMRTDGRVSWGYCRPGGKPVMFNKLNNYLLSVAHSGVTVTCASDLFQLACQVREAYFYYQKKWRDHTSMKALMPANAVTATDLDTPLVRRWAADIDSIGVKRMFEAQRIFKKPIRLANSDEMDWLRIEGIGVPTARRIIKQINGWED